MADAELVITPEVSRKALKKSMSDIDKGMKATAKDTEKYFEDALEDAGEKGGKKAGKGISNGMKAGIAGVAVAVAGALVAGFQVAQEQVASAEGSIGGLLGERDASTNIAFARGQGFTTAELSALNSRVARAGGDDQMGRDFTVDTSEYIAQARKGENDLLANYSQYEGPDQFNAILANLAGRDADDVNKFLADIGWAGDAGVIFNMLDELGGKTGDEAYRTLQKITAQDKERARLMEREAELEKDFAEITRNANVNVKTGLLENIDDATLSQYQKGLEAQGRAEINAVKNYAENAKITRGAEEIKRELDSLMLEVFKVIAPIIGVIASAFKWLDSLSKPKTQEEINAATNSAITHNETGITGADTNNPSVTYSVINGRVIRQG